MSTSFDRWFPIPKFLLPPAAGIDISDSSIKWLVLAPAVSRPGFEVAAWGQAPLAAGVVVGGLIRDARALADALMRIKPHLAGVSCAHAALPEEAGYVFSMHVPPGSDRKQALSLIEFEFDGRVPIPPPSAVYDYNPIERDHGATGDEIGVVVFPNEVAESYAAAFDQAGITLLSLEIEARSIARAVSSHEANEPITLLVDFGRARSGIAVLKRGIPIFTSTVEVGGEAIMQAAGKALSAPFEEAERFANTEGLVAKDGARAPAAEAIATTAAALADEIARHYRFWDTRRNQEGQRMTPVGKIVLVGGSANVNGLPEFLAGRIQARVERGNIWRHICSFDDYIPPMEARISMQFATAAGLALRGL